MKNALAGLNSRLDITAETIRDFQDRSVGKSGKAVAIPIPRAVGKVVWISSAAHRTASEEVEGWVQLREGFCKI